MWLLCTLWGLLILACMALSFAAGDCDCDSCTPWAGREEEGTDG